MRPNIVQPTSIQFLFYLNLNSEYFPCLISHVHPSKDPVVIFMHYIFTRFLSVFVDLFAYIFRLGDCDLLHFFLHVSFLKIIWSFLYTVVVLFVIRVLWFTCQAAVSFVKYGIQLASFMCVIIYTHSFDWLKFKQSGALHDTKNPHFSCHLWQGRDTLGLNSKLNTEDTRSTGVTYSLYSPSPHFSLPSL